MDLALKVTIVSLLFKIHRVSLKQSLSLQELELHLDQVRAHVEEGSMASPRKPLSCYMMPDEESTLAAQVRALGQFGDRPPCPLVEAYSL